MDVGWTIKKAEHRRINAFKLWYWRRLLKGCWTARRSKQSILKEINTAYSLEGMMLKLKLQYFGHLMQRANSLEKPWCWERSKAGAEGDNRGRDVGWHHRLNGHEFERVLGHATVHRVTKSQTWLTELNWKIKMDISQWLKIQSVRKI